MKVIITIPAYNEEKTLPKVIKDIKEIMSETNYDYQILVVNDGSQDKTAEVAKNLGVIVVSHKRNKGLAETFKIEMEECLKLGADIIVHTDADGQYPSEYIPKLIRKMEEGYNLVLGSRFIKKKYSGSILKYLGNRAFAKALSSLTKTKITDSTTGFRAFTKEVAQEINFINTFTYTQEQIIKASKQGFRITEIPISTNKTRDSRLFKNPLQYAFKAWINIFRIYRDYNPLAFFGIAGLFLLLVGCLLGFYFIYLHFTIGITGHLGLLFLLVILFFTGIQTIIFGFLADMLKK
ncbi:MAG: glycosyltransferase family 2 protein [Nanoarchaeota archaeon]|nr:glycosyltransferase family 2 protein [Nanoarchaeota archaeon]